MIRDGFAQLHAIVLAGGVGRRMREMVRFYAGREVPKQYCGFGCEQTLLQATVKRTTRIVDPRRVTVVVGEAWESLARSQLQEFPGIAILAQPEDRGTGTGLLWPLVELAGRVPDAVVLVTPVDHAILDERAYWRGILTAYEAVSSGQAGIVLLGAHADTARTDYGWIVPASPDGAPLQPVEEFVEKPPRAQAQRLLRRGALWNTMVLVARAGALEDLLGGHRPDNVSCLRRACAVEPASREGAVRRAYETLERVDLSHDVFTAVRNLHVVRWPCCVGWSDVGVPERMADFLHHRKEEKGENGDSPEGAEAAAEPVLTALPRAAEPQQEER